ILLLLIGRSRLPVLPFHQLLLVILTYPFVLFFDLWACLLGFFDFLFGRPTWAKIQRTHAEDVLDSESGSSSFWIVSRWAGAVSVLAFLVVSFNDLTADA